MIKFYYGLSGTFKSTTIESEKKKLEDCSVIKSMIKSWKDLETGIYSGMITRNDLNYALLHLCILEHELKYNSHKNTLVERGVTDMAYYKMRIIENFGDNINDSWIIDSVKKELELCNETPQKILLVQKDINFIKDTILKEPTRKEVFPGGLDDYLENQERYIEFTKKYNNISDIVYINNAMNYINNLSL